MRLLDLYCGEGLISWGYWRSGCFSEIIGVDIDPRMRNRYAFDFVCADAIKLDYEFLMQFDFIHASPPCQAYSKLTRDRTKHPRLITPTHHMLFSTGKPYVIENVEGSGAELRPNLIIDGLSLGLGMKRIRYFHVSILKHSIRQISAGRAIYFPHANRMSRNALIEAFGLKDYVSEQCLSCLTCDGIKQGVPPAFSYWIATTFIRQKAWID